MSRVMTQTVETLGWLLLVAAAVSMLARRVHLPYTVGLVVAGVVISMVTKTLQINLTGELIFAVFLPPLVFDAAFNMPWASLKRELPLVSVLATFGVVISAFVVAIAMHYGLGWDWGQAMLIGALISATDPVAVIAMFRDGGIRGRLQILLESESLLNDGTAAVLFTIVEATMLSGKQDASKMVGSFLIVSFGGILSGVACGICALVLAGRTKDHLIEMTFTTVAAYGSFLAAQQLGFSGVLATMAAGLVLGNARQTGAITEKGHETVDTLWEYMAFVANSLIFILIGVRIAKLDFRTVWISALCVVLSMFVARAIVVYGGCGLFARSRLKVPNRHQHLLVWGGLRGALALALALSLPETIADRHSIIGATFAVVAFSLVVQGLTAPKMFKRLLDSSSPSDNHPETMAVQIGAS